MLGHIKIEERGITPRRLAKAVREANKEEWRILAETFHTKFTPARFTEEHAKKAGYRKRSGEDGRFGTKAFWKSYIGRKIRQKKHRDPLVWSGETKRRAERMVGIVPTSKGVTLRYNLNVLNYIPWARAEFARILPEETAVLTQQFNANIARRINGMQ